LTREISGLTAKNTGLEKQLSDEQSRSSNRISELDNQLKVMQQRYNNAKADFGSSLDFLNSSVKEAIEKKSRLFDRLAHENTNLRSINTQLQLKLSNQSQGNTKLADDREIKRLQQTINVDLRAQENSAQSEVIRQIAVDKERERLDELERRRKAEKNAKQSQRDKKRREEEDEKVARQLQDDINIASNMQEKEQESNGEQIIRFCGICRGQLHNMTVYCTSGNHGFHNECYRVPCRLCFN